MELPETEFIGLYKFRWPIGSYFWMTEFSKKPTNRTDRFGQTERLGRRRGIASRGGGRCLFLNGTRGMAAARAIGDGVDRLAGRIGGGGRC